MKETGNPALLKMSVQDLSTSVRVTNRLTYSGVMSLEELWIISQRHQKEYLQIQNLREIGRAEILDQLKSLGFILKGENENG